MNVIIFKQLWVLVYISKHKQKKWSELVWNELWARLNGCCFSTGDNNQSQILFLLLSFLSFCFLFYVFFFFYPSFYHTKPSFFISPLSFVYLFLIFSFLFLLYVFFQFKFSFSSLCLFLIFSFQQSVDVCRDLCQKNGILLGRGARLIKREKSEKMKMKMKEDLLRTNFFLIYTFE